MIIYIHGFGSSGEGSKAKALRPFFAEEGYVAPSLPTNPKLAISTLSDLIENFSRNDTVSLIGSSLGGFYALHLAQKYGLKAVLINPALRPYTSLEEALGEGENYYDGSGFEWNRSHLELLLSLRPASIPFDRLLVLLQSGDEVLDYRDALETLSEASLIVEEGGNHSFQGIERHISTIKTFFNPSPHWDSQRLVEAITFAAKAHGDQKTPMGLPYLHHLMSVAIHTMVGMRNDAFPKVEEENALIVALLHDTIEDTAITYAEISEAFGEAIAKGVVALTKNTDLGDKSAQMEDSLLRIQTQPHWVWCVKLSDRITNLTGVPPHWSVAKKASYRDEAQKIWEALHPASKHLSAQLHQKIQRYDEVSGS